MKYAYNMGRDWVLPHFTVSTLSSSKWVDVCLVSDEYKYIRHARSMLCCMWLKWTTEWRVLPMSTLSIGKPLRMHAAAMHVVMIQLTQFGQLHWKKNIPNNLVVCRWVDVQHGYVSQIFQTHNSKSTCEPVQFRMDLAHHTHLKG